MSAKELTIEDAFPEKPEFSLQTTGKTYRLRLPNIEDQIWFKKNFGTAQAMVEMFDEKTRDWSKITKVIYRLMEDRSDFLAQAATIENDDGERMQVRLTGPEVLMRSIIGDESIRCLGALSRAMAMSNPVIDKYISEEVKKKGMEIERLTSGKSSTTSRRSMAGRSSTSSQKRRGR